jgi:hypothetical protein
MHHMHGRKPSDGNLRDQLENYLNVVKAVVKVVRSFAVNSPESFPPGLS